MRIKQSPEYDRAGWNNATIEDDDEDEYDYEAPSHQATAPVVSTDLAPNLEAFQSDLASVLSPVVIP